MLKLLRDYLADFRLGRTPKWMVRIGIILLVASWLPLALVALARNSTSSSPRIQIMQDMAKQPKYREQAPSVLFADGRSDRPAVAGTVARGQLELDEDEHYSQGYAVASPTDAAGGAHPTGVTGGPPVPQSAPATGPAWQVRYFETYPARVQITEKLLARGQERFSIYCAACHGLDGYGHGPVSERAIELQEPNSKWVPAASLHSDQVRARPVGYLFNTITNGIRTMPAYGPQITVEDRWAIVAYIRALQLSQHATVGDVPPDKRPTLR